MLDKEFFIGKTKKEIEMFFSNNLEELSIFKALKIYDLLSKEYNNLFELIEDWFSLQNYEKYKLQKDNFKFLKYLVESEINDLKKDVFLSKSLDNKELKLLKEFAKIALQIYGLRSKMENYLREKAKELYPNMVDVAGPILSLRLLFYTKDLKSFSELPASTIQLIGAESALFRALKYKKKMPKYGFLYLHPLMQGLTNHNKGKLARFMANKLALASRFDLNKKENQNLSKEVEAKAKKLKSGQNVSKNKK